MTNPNPRDPKPNRVSLRDDFLSIAIVLGAFFAFPIPSMAASNSLHGRATVIDGDTLDVQGARVRLAMVDAPESRQTCSDADGRSYRCGQRAAFALADWLGSSPIRCQVDSRDRYRRLIAHCFKGEASVNAWLVANGHAIAYRRYGTRYVPEEVEARRSRRGIWQGAFQEPAVFRRSR
jgi:endonuclease YncB( thermonuclease family)